MTCCCSRFIALMIPIFSSIASAEEVTVLYPDVSSPYDKIFQQITAGIERSGKVDVIHVKLPTTFSAEQIQQQITTQKVIALGKRGWSVAKLISNQKNVVVGSYPLKPNGISGVTLMADPSIVFTSLQELAPEINTITVVYSNYSKWIIEIAKQKAQDKGLTLVPIYVTNLKDAVKAYDKIFEQSNKKSALWLPLDSLTTHDTVIIPTILKKAWQNKLVVFSSKPTHAKRGALFSTLPDHSSLGKQLASFIAKKTMASKPEVQTLNHAKLAVNLRTADHLGYRYSATERADFSLTFPTNYD